MRPVIEVQKKIAQNKRSSNTKGQKGASETRSVGARYSAKQIATYIINHSTQKKILFRQLVVFPLHILS
jgi:hypothetical protein